MMMKIAMTVRGSLLLTVFYVTMALAAPNGLNGDWSGSAEAIYPDGTQVAGLLFDGSINQEPGSGLFQGSFTYTIPGMGQISGVVTGFMDKGGTLTGLLSVVPDEGEPPVAVATVQGKLTGNKIFAVICDFSDGTTSTLTAYRVR
jgi:hypothetical protein